MPTSKQGTKKLLKMAQKDAHQTKMRRSYKEKLLSKSDNNPVLVLKGVGGQSVEKPFGAPARGPRSLREFVERGQTRKLGSGFGSYEPPRKKRKSK